MTTITQTIGIEESVRVVARTLKRFAAPGKLPNRDGMYQNLRRVGDIEIFFDVREDRVGHAAFHFVTWDNVDVSVDVDFSALTREYLQNLENEVLSKMNQHRTTRETLIITCENVVPFLKKP